MKKYLQITLIAFLSVLVCSCMEDEDPPQPDFSASISSGNQINVSFTDLSTDGPNEWYWTFEGGSPSTSTQQNPIVTYSSPGTYDVSLVVKNGGGENEIVMYDYVSIAKFNNPTWTDIDITVNTDTKTIPVDDYVLFGQIDNTLMDYQAETYGETSSGTQIGLDIYWDNNVDLTEGSSWNLIINSDFVFFTVTNTGPDDLYPFYVNYGTSDQTQDDIIIENDGYTKNTGYYYANYNMEVRAYKYTNQSAYVFWLESNFILPWDNNQGIELRNSLKSALEVTKMVKDVKDQDGGNLIQSGAKR